MFSRSLVVLLAICAGWSARAQWPPATERMLLPITATDAPGAGNTVWSSYARAYIDAEVAPEFFPKDGCVWPGNPNPVEYLPFCDLPNSPLRAGLHHLGFYPTLSGETPGSYVYVERSGVDSIQFSLYVQEKGGVALQVPVVREQEFSSTIRILDVPDLRTHRVLLRVYGSDPEVLGSVRVRVLQGISSRAPTLLLDQVLNLMVVQRYLTLNRIPTRPPYAQLSFTTPLTEEDDTVWIEVSSLSPDLRIWAFVSATNNSTQQFFLRTP